MKVWVDSSDALWRAVKSLELKKVKVHGYRLADFYSLPNGDRVEFFLGDSRIH